VVKPANLSKFAFMPLLLPFTFSLCLWPIRRHLPHHEVCEENDERSVQRLARGPVRSQSRPPVRLAIDLYPAEGPRIDIIRLMLQAILNQSRYPFTFTP
jgi:hypothetical protein